ncbi:aldehyde dehydrogenase family protein [Providencia rettgeri]|nr:aldehyde dehydrogenase family protein [Providencia rettgeri]
MPRRNFRSRTRRYAIVDEDDLIQQANDSVYGLAAGIWTKITLGRLSSPMHDVGTVWVNTYKSFFYFNAIWRL